MMVKFCAGLRREQPSLHKSPALHKSLQEPLQFGFVQLPGDLVVPAVAESPRTDLQVREAVPLLSDQQARKHIQWATAPPAAQARPRCQSAWRPLLPTPKAERVVSIALLSCYLSAMW